MMLRALFISALAGANAYATSPQYEQVVDTWQVYGGYTGSSVVTGAVIIHNTGTGTTQDIDYNLAGVDSLCSSGPGSAANSCGIHIHAGVDCTNGGGHYYNKVSVTTDPWTHKTYTSTTSGTTTKTTGHFDVITGYDRYQVFNKVVIVHDYDGARASCGIIRDPVDLKLLMEYHRITKYNCKHMSMIAHGHVKAEQPFSVFSKPARQAADELRHFPILSTHNCQAAHFEVN